MALALWAMTVVVAPILGPIFGGTISGQLGWHRIFYINLPIVALLRRDRAALMSGASRRRR